MAKLIASLIAFLVVATLLAIIVARIWHRLGRRRREAFIDSYPYGKFLDQRLSAQRPELSPEQREQVFDGLRDYFHLCNTAGQRMVAMPSQAVDDAWHEFILFTRQYEQFCRNAFGRFLHHTPAEAMPSPTAAGNGIKRTWRLACARENIDPKKPYRLPRLFALDALLLAGGFIYQLDCMAAGQAGAGYCAIYIGCGGCCSGDSGGADGDGGSGGGCGGD